MGTIGHKSQASLLAWPGSSKDRFLSGPLSEKFPLGRGFLDELSRFPPPLPGTLGSEAAKETPSLSYLL